MFKGLAHSEWKPPWSSQILPHHPYQSPGLGSGEELGNFGQSFKNCLRNLDVFILFLTQGLTV